MRDISRDTLIEASKGDISAFEQVYRSACDFVFNIAYRVSGNRQEAEEVAQDVFLKIYNNLKGFRFQSSFKTWIYRIAVNTAINAAKRRNKELSRNVEYNDDIGGSAAYAPAEGSAERQENSELVESLLGALNPDQRACVVLRDIEGLSYQEMAQALKININTVRSRLKRARQAMLAMGQRGVMGHEL